MNILNYWNMLSANTKFFVGFLFLVLLVFIFKYASNLIEFGFSKVLKARKVSNKAWVYLSVKNKLFSSFLFAILVFFLPPLTMVVLGDHFAKLTFVCTRIFVALSIVATMIAIGSFLDVLADKFQRSIKLPVKGIVQALKIVAWIITIILVLSALLNKEPLYFLGGLTALSAILLLIFKDAILGLVSGVQLSINDLVRVGDWITISGQDVDGTVIDILLTTIRVQNWDNTIVNIPAYNLVANSFTNWRGPEAWQLQLRVRRVRYGFHRLGQIAEAFESRRGFGRTEN